MINISNKDNSPMMTTTATVSEHISSDRRQVMVRGASCGGGDMIIKSGNNNNNNSDSNTNNNMDELSIDSMTNEKIKNSANNSGKITKQVTQVSNNGTHQKAHFRIDWRQLTYYQKQSSFMSKLFGQRKQQQKTLAIDCQSDNINSGYNQSPSSLTKQPQAKRILNSLDGCFKSGELSAILGPSGAGKSTFLSTLFGAKQEGAYGQTKVTWFGGESTGCSEQASRMRRYIKIAQLPQHDHLLHHLTVYETLMFASKIKNCTGDKMVVGRNFHRQNVKRVVKMLKLNDCLDTRCGKLSGGQYKRVSIGQELLSEPDVIILDEPTSGLDAMTCLTTVQTLKSIVMKHPMSIILTIHQPDMDVFNLFDHVYVIAQGGLAIYEGPPAGIMPTLAEANLHPPVANYNPARFIVEHAFLYESPEHSSLSSTSATSSAVLFGSSSNVTVNHHHHHHHHCTAVGNQPQQQLDHQQCNSSSGADSCLSSSSSDEDDDDDDDDDDDKLEKTTTTQNYIKRSVLSLTEAISGKETVSHLRDKKPLLNIGFQTLGGKLISARELQALSAQEKKNQIQQTERWNLLRQLNQIQKAKYKDFYLTAASDISSSQSPQDDVNGDDDVENDKGDNCHDQVNEPGKSVATCRRQQQQQRQQDFVGLKVADDGSAQSDYSSSGWLDQATLQRRQQQQQQQRQFKMSSKAISLSQLPFSHPQPDEQYISTQVGLSGRRSLQTVIYQGPPEDDHESSSSTAMSSSSDEVEEFVVNFPATPECYSDQIGSGEKLLKRQFDKRLSAKHNCSKQNHDYPIYYHAFLLTHRTWLSIVRDPIFFGIQAIMHTTIPLLLAIIFGSVQEEGCPQIGNFDLVKFAYSDPKDNFIEATMTSIRQSIGNIGINFFEIFVLCFSINCITALVFPSDMHVLLKEYRNGWYALRSYFFGRTLADLPVPVVLHSIGISILYFMTGQPHSALRFGSIIVLVILSSLISQSVGLTIGALLMKSSQSAVLAAAAIVSPFFALSGFIVRIHTLPLMVQFFAKASYLYHLLNGFIILRYGFNRCHCDPQDFELNSEHQIPKQLHTMASIWIGTYSNEYSQSQAVQQQLNGINNNSSKLVDPNIDVVDKMMNAFKMANSYGHQIETCDDVLPYAMIDFNLRDQDIYNCFLVLIVMVIATRFMTFLAIYYKIRSFA